MLHQIKTSAYVAMPMGVYAVEFVGYKPCETKNGVCYLWSFKTTDGKLATGFAGNPGMVPSPNNKFGRWLCAIAGRPLSVGEVDPDIYVGKKYQAMVGETGNVEMFTVSAA